MEDFMDISGIAQTASTIADTGTKQAVGVAVLKKRRIYRHPAPAR
jgi:hypothetical protein